MLEHAELHPTIIDLDPRQGGDDAAGLLVEILSPGRDQIALRGGKRYTPYLQAWNPQAVDLPVLQRPPSFDTQRDGNLRILATQPGILNSLAQRCANGRRRRPGRCNRGRRGRLNFSDVLKALGICPAYRQGSSRSEPNARAG